MHSSSRTGVPRASYPTPRYRLVVGHKLSCARDTIEYGGVGGDVTLVDDLTSALAVEQPVGFVYLDDGKIRFYNERACHARGVHSLLLVSHCARAHTHTLTHMDMDMDTS